MTYSYHTKSKWEVQIPAGLHSRKKAYIQKYRDIRLAYNVIKQYGHFTHPPKDMNVAIMIWHL